MSAISLYRVEPLNLSMLPMICNQTAIGISLVTNQTTMLAMMQDQILVLQQALAVAQAQPKKQQRGGTLISFVYMSFKNSYYIISACLVVIGPASTLRKYSTSTNCLSFLFLLILHHQQYIIYDILVLKQYQLFFLTSRLHLTSELLIIVPFTILIG